jgi:hypothetical protein
MPERAQVLPGGEEEMNWGKIASAITIVMTAVCATILLTLILGLHTDNTPRLHHSAVQGIYLFTALTFFGGCAVYVDLRRKK